MRFFLPGHRDDLAAERIYALLAERAGLPVLPKDQRIAEIKFRHRNVVWTATVGDKLTGVTETSVVREHRTLTVLEAKTDGATVVAIFPDRGYYWVFTDAHPSGDIVSEWDNPFHALLPTNVVLFSP